MFLTAMVGALFVAAVFALCWAAVAWADRANENENENENENKNNINNS